MIEKRRIHFTSKNEALNCNSFEAMETPPFFKATYFQFRIDGHNRQRWWPILSSTFVLLEGIALTFLALDGRCRRDC